jgi:hypothetical protein
MTDSNIAEKIGETITNLFKKKNIFEKIERTELILKSTAYFLIINGFFTFYNYYILNKNDKTVKEIHAKMNKLIDHQEKCKITRSTSTSDLQSNYNKTRNNTINDFNNQDNQDNELLNECYHNIPCNNLKKTTGIFGWK